MNKIWLITTILITLFITIIVGIQKPTLDKPVSINNGQLVTQIKETETVSQEPKINDVSVPIVETKLAPVETQKIETVAKATPTPTTKKAVKTTQQPKKEVVKKQEKTITPKKEEPKTTTPVIQEVAEPIIEITPAKTEEPKKKVLTEEEEIIAWNKWRSDIQNSIMRDYKTPAPLGTTYVFSFSVDKWGNLSNISVGCETSICPKNGTDNIRTIISGLNNKGLLTFPEGTQRIMTVVKGSFVIVASDYQFSTPDDYSDYEKIKRQVER